MYLCQFECVCVYMCMCICVHVHMSYHCWFGLDREIRRDGGRGRGRGVVVIYAQDFEGGTCDGDCFSTLYCPPMGVLLVRLQHVLRAEAEGGGGGRSGGEQINSKGKKQKKRRYSKNIPPKTEGRAEQREMSR